MFRLFEHKTFQAASQKNTARRYIQIKIRSTNSFVLQTINKKINKTC